MIDKFKTIKSLAIFKDFSWDNQVKQEDGQIQTFKKINILYGRNYSGKTTLSRIIRALETGEFSSNYDDPQFIVSWNDKSESTITNMQNHGKTIRVFNEDFVRENLSFLKDSTNSEGYLNSFAIIGANNIKIEKEIKILEEGLGCAEEGKETGLFAKIKAKQNEYTLAIDNYNKAYESLQKKKADKATGRQSGIKYRSDTFGDQNYTITKLDDEIQLVLDPSYTPIDDAKRQELELSLSEVSKSDIPPLSVFPFEFQMLSDKAKELIERKIGGSEKIKELVLDYTLNEWVKKGREIHKDKLKDCAFCGNKITSERWEILEKHFDEETNYLEGEIAQLIGKIKTHKQLVENGLNIVSKESFYKKYHKEIEEIHNKYKKVALLYCGQLDILDKILINRKENITSDFSFEPVTNYTPEIEEVFKEYENVRIQSNNHTNALSNAKIEAQRTLRLHEVRTFVDTIDYVSENNKILLLEIEKKNREVEKEKLQSDINSRKQAIDYKRSQLNDEEKGAQRVNDYLNNFFGHKFITLEAIADKNTENKQIRFEVYRNNKKAFNLSEGECSLIAFCYFIAKLEDVNTIGKTPIIWIDDPVSSLDGNHIFFVYSLLRAKIVDNQRFEQLFISTHNLEFLKYLKRLTGKDIQGNDYHKRWLIIEREGDNSNIKRMPNYLKEYITEFNYLFHQIYKCAKISTPSDDNYHITYGFGNNLRKFIDIYTYYKYPDGKPEIKVRDEKILNLFGDKVSAYLSDRLMNEHSHLSGSFERASSPIDIPEIQSVALKVLKVIKSTDKEQYESFLKSIGEVDIIEETITDKVTKNDKKSNMNSKKRKAITESQALLFDEKIFESTTKEKTTDGLTK